MPISAHRLAAVSLVMLASAGSLGAQGTPRTAHRITWWEAGAAAAGVGLLYAVDGRMHHLMQRNYDEGDWKPLASTFRRMGEPTILVGVPLALMASGAIAGDGGRGVVSQGKRALASGVIAGTVAMALKLATARERPSCGCPPNRFGAHGHLAVSFPSGHTAVAFALATSFADGIHNRWASLALYAAAGTTAWSRMYSEKHWLSDVGAGALLGITSARLVDRRWRIFGLRPPAVTPGLGGTTVSYLVRF
jgi:membrane-associated phospholipid phosphatase